MDKIHFSRNEVVKTPVEIGSVNHVVIEDNAEVVLIAQASRIKSDVKTQVTLGDHAKLTYVNILDSLEASLNTTLEVTQGRGSVLQSLVCDLGEVRGQHHIKSVLSGEGAECYLDGLFVLGQSQRSAHKTIIDHATAHTTSAEYYKGILSGQSEGEFEGKIIVRPHAQKTSSKQMNRNLLLSKSALIHTQPLLEIFANDVKCQHGATIGRLDEQVLFYLQARGISREDAARLLTQAFAYEIIARAPESLRDSLNDLVIKRLGDLQS